MLSVSLAGKNDRPIDLGLRMCVEPGMSVNMTGRNIDKGDPRNLAGSHVRVERYVT